MALDFTFDYDFFKAIILVIIPVGVGAILAPIITRKWQTRSAKIKIKKVILESFAKSAQYQKNTLHQFLGLFLRTYGNVNKNEYDFETGTLFDLKVPLTGNDIPKYKLQKEFEKMNQRFEESKISSESEFLSLILLYYRDDDLIKNYLQITKETTYIWNIMYELMQVQEKGEKYQELLEDYKKKFSSINKSIGSFAHKIVKQDIKI